MALSSVTYTGNGSTTSFAIPFPYLFQSDVSATVNGVTTAFTWTNPALVHFATAPITGSAVFIVRKTNITTLDVVFTDGSTVQASDINTAELQSLYLAQEANDGVSVAIAAAATATAATGAANAAAAAANAAVAGLVPFTGDTGIGGVRGLVPAPPAGSFSAGKFLSAGGSWVAPPTAASVGTNMITAGADPTGATDSTAAFQTVCTAIGATGGRIIIPPGRYKIASQVNLSIAAGKVVDIGGTSPDLTTLVTPTGSILSVTTVDQTCGINVHDLTMTTQANVGAAITVIQGLSSAGPNGAVSNFTNLTFRGDTGYGSSTIFATCILLSGGVSYVNFTNVFATGGSGFSGNGVQLTGDTARSQYGVSFNFVNCTFNFLANGILYGSFIQGVACVNCNFTGCVNGIVQPAGATGSAFQLAVSNSQFACRTVCINAAVGITGVYINGCEITGLVNSWEGVAGVFVAAAIVGNTFINTTFTGSLGIVTANGSNGVAITGNVFDGLSFGVLAQSVSTNVNVQSNVYIGVTTPSSPAATTGTIKIGGGSA